jgi:predicted MFS family arabinose efflux permease
VKRPATVGLLFAVMGVAGLFTTTLFGRLNSEGRERQWLAWPQLALGVPMLAIAFAPNLFVVAAALAVAGLLIGPIDIALFTLRQRRTDPAWLGRAFAISMAMNFSGVPIGAALAGQLVVRSLTSTLVLAAVLTVAAGLVPLFLIRAAGEPAPSPAAGEAEPTS